MNAETSAVSATPETLERATASRRFQASVGRFDDAPTREVIDDLAAKVSELFADDLQKRPSKHAYIRTLPDEMIHLVGQLRDSAVIRESIRRQFAADSVMLPMKHTDELYISHYNKDFGGDQGLFSKHYDGSMRFLSFGSVVRALIYLQSDATYKVVFGDSQVEQAFVTYEFGLLDFHRELHWVEGEYNPADQQRILLKCNYLILPQNAGLLGRAVQAANTTVFYTVKAAMEYSKSPTNPAQYAVGGICNLFRVLNNVHPFIPLLLLVLAMASFVGVVLKLVI